MDVSAAKEDASGVVVLLLLGTPTVAAAADDDDGLVLFCFVSSNMNWFEEESNTNVIVYLGQPQGVGTAVRDVYRRYKYLRVRRKQKRGAAEGKRCSLRQVVSGLWYTKGFLVALDTNNNNNKEGGWVLHPQR